MTRIPSEFYDEGELGESSSDSLCKDGYVWFTTGP